MSSQITAHEQAKQTSPHNESATLRHDNKNELAALLNCLLTTSPTIPWCVNVQIGLAAAAAGISDSRILDAALDASRQAEGPRWDEIVSLLQEYTEVVTKT